MSDLRMELIQGQLNDIEENVRSIKATWGNTIMTLDNIKSSLKAYRQKAIDEAYQKGFEAGSHEATTLEYQQGLNDAWECARRLVWETSLNEAEHMGFIAKEKSAEILRDYTVTAAMKAVELYDKKLEAEIKVGDEVVAFSGKAIVFRRFTDDKGEDVCSYWYPDENRINRDRTSSLEKTGRHFPQIKELIEAMKEGAK